MLWKFDASKLQQQKKHTKREYLAVEEAVV